LFYWQQAERYIRQHSRGVRFDLKNDAFVAFDRVQKSYDGETLVVKDLNLSIAQGRVPDDAGPVGLGQDDLPDDAGGFETATHGEIRLTASRSTTSRRTSAASAWCSRTTRCSRT
jgi:ABC-type transporter Mla maintaining outer membrane lipid asymmetry ATPase subunit MlaF